MWYVRSRGSKYNYLKPLEEIFQSLAPGKVVIEPFAGTYTVTHLLVRSGAKRVLSSDIGLWSYVIGKALSSKSPVPVWRPTTSSFLKVNKGNAGAKAAWVVTLLESKRAITPKVIQSDDLDLSRVKQVWERIKSNLTSKIIPHRQSYRTFLQRRAPGKVVYVDTPKVFGKRTAFDYYAEIDERLNDPLSQTDRGWTAENVKKRHEEIFKLIRPAKMVIWEAYKKAEPSWEWIQGKLESRFSSVEPVTYKNDVIFVCSQ